MNFKLVWASQNYKNVIRNLIQFYMYDFSEYLPLEVEADGLFTPYPHLDDYWKEDNNRFPYILLRNEKPIGFVLVQFIESVERSHFSIAEFFIMKKYRREGIGKAAAKHVFDLHRGRWEIYQKESNIPAQLFWKKVIDDYTKGNFTQRSADGKSIQDFEN